MKKVISHHSCKKKIKNFHLILHLDLFSRPSGKESKKVCVTLRNAEKKYKVQCYDRQEIGQCISFKFTHLKNNKLCLNKIWPRSPFRSSACEPLHCSSVWITLQKSHSDHWQELVYNFAIDFKLAHKTNMNFCVKLTRLSCPGSSVDPDTTQKPGSSFLSWAVCPALCV